jgi:purine-binding chemotaxis protein CheW
MTTDEYLSFIVDEEEYGVPILDVREVRGWTPVREVPSSPDFMLGVLEIRGEYVPIVDLRQRFNLDKATIDATTVVVVLNDAEMVPLGVIVDGVSEVYPLIEEQIKPPPALSTSTERAFIKGIAQVPNGELILLNMEALFERSELMKSDCLV